MNFNSTKKTTVIILAMAFALISLNSQGQSRYAQSSTRHDHFRDFKPSRLDNEVREHHV